MIGLFNASRDANKKQATVDICFDLLNSGGYMTFMALDLRHRSHASLLYYLPWTSGPLEDYSVRLVWQLADQRGIQGMLFGQTNFAFHTEADKYADIDLPEELLPLAYRSKDLLESLLRKGVNLGDWVHSYAQWPAGLSLLLQSGYRPTPATLRSACGADCEESVRILLNTHECYVEPAMLRAIIKHHNPAITDLVLQALIDRRKRLQVLAETYLPGEMRYQLGINSDTLLNFHAYRAYQALNAISIDVDDVKEKYAWSVYDSIGANLQLADRLWDAGFRNVDEVDNDGETCLTRLRQDSRYHDIVSLLEIINWLVTKGADIDRKISSIPALHVLAKAVGDALHRVQNTTDIASALSQTSKSCTWLIRRMFLDTTRDSCCCYCSPKGCSGLSRLLGGLFPTWPHECMKELVQRLAAVIEIFFDLEEFKPPGHLSGEVVPYILRFITCRSLGISDTCTHGRYKRFEPEKIREIQDEEKPLVALRPFPFKVRGALFEFTKILDRLLADAHG